MLSNLSELKTTTKWGTRIVLGFAAILSCSFANAEVVEFNVDVVYDEFADDDRPYTAPNAILNYAFSLDTDTAFQSSGLDFVLEFADVDIAYTLDGVTTNHTAFVRLSNGEGNPLTNSRVTVLNVDSRQLNIDLDPSVELWGAGDFYFIEDGVHEGIGALAGATSVNRFDGRVTIGDQQTVPEPSAAILMLGGLSAMSLVRRRKG